MGDKLRCSHCLPTETNTPGPGREDSTISTAQPRKAPYIGIVAVSGHRVVLENIGVRKHTSYLVAVLELPLLKKPNI